MSRPRLNLMIVQSRSLPRCVSVRVAIDGERAHHHHLQPELTRAGFEAGQRAVLITEHELEDLEERARGRR